MSRPIMIVITVKSIRHINRYWPSAESSGTVGISGAYPTDEAGRPLSELSILLARLSSSPSVLSVCGSEEASRLITVSPSLSALLVGPPWPGPNSSWTANSALVHYTLTVLLCVYILPADIGFDPKERGHKNVSTSKYATMQCTHACEHVPVCMSVCMSIFSCVFWVFFLHAGISKKKGLRLWTYCLLAMRDLRPS